MHKLSLQHDGFTLNFHYTDFVTQLLGEHDISPNDAFSDKEKWFKNMLFPMLQDKDGRPRRDLGESFTIIPHRFTNDMVLNCHGTALGVPFDQKKVIASDGKMTFPMKGVVFYLIEKA